MKQSTAAKANLERMLHPDAQNKGSPQTVRTFVMFCDYLVLEGGYQPISKRAFGHEMFGPRVFIGILSYSFFYLKCLHSFFILHLLLFSVSSANLQNIDKSTFRARFMVGRIHENNKTYC